jgi:hypothetical protein
MPRWNDGDPLAYFLTWSTYGTWLPGDTRGWIEYRHGWRLPDPVLELESAARMTENACRLSIQQRRIVEAQIVETCQIRGWLLHAVNCRSNHLHVVVTANRHPKIVRNQLKAWCTRRLKEAQRHELAMTGGRTRGNSTTPRILSCAVVRQCWWAERGSQRFINDEETLELAILYVREGQDKPRESY